MSKPRIRSIKPEFWKDGKIRRLSDSCALFFIGLWNFCDDDGKCRNDSFELASNLSRFKSQHISKWIQILFEAGLVQLSTDFRWVSIVNWKHQRIDRPHLPEIRKSEIEWLPIPAEPLSTNARRMLDDTSTINRRKDRIGSDRKGSDRISSPGVQAPAVVAPEVLPQKKSKAEPVTRATWEAYADAYSIRYHTDPVRNATVNSQLAQFVKRLGEGEAPSVAAFYLTHNDQFYVRSMHPVGLMLRDAEKLRTEWATRRQVTSTAARGVDRAQATMDAFDQGFAAVNRKESAS